jgi:hypothetical protein
MYQSHLPSKEMKRMKKTGIIGLALVLGMVLSVGFVFATNDKPNGWEKNQNDGCAAKGGDLWVFLGSYAIPVEFHPVYGYPTEFHYSSNGAWLGGACCASNVVMFEDGGEAIYEGNSCCRPPDSVEPMVGNHCICFDLRDYTGFP